MPTHNEMLSLIYKLAAMSDGSCYMEPHFFRFPANPFYRNPFLKSTNYWSVIDRHSFESPRTSKELFCENNEHIDPDIVKVFGEARPPANAFLLHHAIGNNLKSHNTPVLLVHGAGHNANIWADPLQTGGPGLMHYLVANNYPVFAITFSHPHGDNYLQAEQLAAAIRQVKIITQKPQVDLVVHSKGGIPARIYLSNINKQWGTSYRNDVRRLLMLGVPNLGLDYSFRKPLTNYLIYTTKANAAISWYRMLLFGQVIDTKIHSFYQNSVYPGQCQLLYRWDKKYPLEILQPDWYTTYYGGQGVLSASLGIDKAIAEGGYLMELLEDKGIDKNVAIAVLAGNKNDLTSLFTIKHGPSDGIVFTDSALHTGALTQKGARLLAKGEAPLNHLELITLPMSWKWIHLQLQA